MCFAVHCFGILNRENKESVSAVFQEFQAQLLRWDPQILTFKRT
jgi:hypothetical protein